LLKRLQYNIDVMVDDESDETKHIDLQW